MCFCIAVQPELSLPFWVSSWRGVAVVVLDSLTFRLQLLGQPDFDRREKEFFCGVQPQLKLMLLLPNDEKT